MLKINFGGALLAYLISLLLTRWGIPELYILLAAVLIMSNVNWYMNIIFLRKYSSYRKNKTPESVDIK